MKKRPDFCVYDQYVVHSTMDCYSLQRIYHEKLAVGKIKLERVSIVLDKLLPNHKEKETCNTITHSEAPEGKEVEMMENIEVIEDDSDPGLQVTALINGVKFRKDRNNQDNY